MRKIKKIFALIMMVTLLAGSSITAFAEEAAEMPVIYTYNLTTYEIEKNEMQEDGIIFTPVTEISGGGILWFVYGVSLHVNGQEVSAYDNGNYYEYTIPATSIWIVEVGRLEDGSMHIFLDSNLSGGVSEPANDSVAEHEHDYEWVITVEPTEDMDGLAENICKYCPAKDGSQPVSKATAWVKGITAKIKNAPEAGTVVVESDSFFCYTAQIMEALKLRPDVTLTTYFTDEEGNRKGFTIPAGQAPCDGAQFYGFTGLGNTYGWIATAE